MMPEISERDLKIINKALKAAEGWIEKINSEPWECVKRCHELFGYTIKKQNCEFGPPPKSPYCYKHYCSIKCKEYRLDCKPLHESFDALREFEDRLTDAQFNIYVVNLFKVIYKTNSVVMPTRGIEIAKYILNSTPAQHLAALLVTMEEGQ